MGSQTLSSTGPEYPAAHILGVALEVRQKVYNYILTNIHEEARSWEKSPKSSYDGLRWTCKQLYYETTRSIFLHRVSKQQLSDVISIPINKVNVHKLRSLYLRVDLAFGIQGCYDLAGFLNRFQLSLQELHLIFSGKDASGIQTGFRGCGDRSHQTICFQEELFERHQEIEKKLLVLRQIPTLRNLGILRIENMNIAIPRPALLANKPYLQALSVTCDPRSQVTDIPRVARRNSQLFAGLLMPVRPFPPVAALTLDANAVFSIEALVNNVAKSLRHLSWIIPGPEHHTHLQNDLTSFYNITERLMQTLWRIPQLEALRLCINPSRGPTYPMWCRRNTAPVTESLHKYLPHFKALKHLEIHESGNNEYYYNGLINDLPRSLRRLYLCSRTIPAARLADLVQRRYFHGEDDNEYSYGANVVPIDNDFAFYNTLEYQRGSCLLSETSEAGWIRVNSRGFVEYFTQEELDSAETPTDGVLLVHRDVGTIDDSFNETGIVGEYYDRFDKIPLYAGKLGFITFEYNVQAEVGESRGRLDNRQYDDCYMESDRTRILKLNGRLLDREHNMHLAISRAANAEQAVAGSFDRRHGTFEDERNSQWPDIRQALLHPCRKTRHPFTTKQFVDELEQCFDDPMTWYFGNEVAAEEVFKKEPVAKHDGQRIKATIEEVPVSSGCHWMSPDYEVPPVGSFPLPPLPRDWKDDMQ
ncbi:hypothetical protein LTR05_003115 [Lithohypha guttulata]|uniref:Uncharacterized protein n=1 Tax=Lithohypha guttulata TaxID=1690604 RepID=A0AAN7T5A2_9EURO|nr:hypothetical protein LTR05_003115 [Lithohypha guttulata]